MSANLIVDLGGTALMGVSIGPLAGVGGTPASGIIVGQPLDFNNANTFCNVVAAGTGTSGLFRVMVQTSDTNTSGSFTDPTSGLAQLPTSFLSGGILIVGSGSLGFASGVPLSGNMSSGGMQAAAFQRPHQYVRAIVMSGNANNHPVTVAFVSQLRTTGSGPGFTWAPQNSGSNTINV
jgi:hypothetical protein